MTTLLPPTSGKRSLLSMSNVSVSSTCHGQCKQSKIPAQIAGIAEQQLKWAMGGKDKKITKDEVPEAMQGMFGRLDKNADGAIDAAEIQALRQRSGGSGRSGGEGGRRRGGERLYDCRRHRRVVTARVHGSRIGSEPGFTFVC